MRKLLQTLWLPLIFLVLPLQLEAQNGWVAYPLSITSGTVFHFGDANNGLILNPYGSPTPKYLRSTNGGSNWISHTPPDSQSFYQYFAIYFLNGQTGWMGSSYQVSTFTGGYTYKTTNGGLTWLNRVDAGPINDIQFINENTGYAATGSVPSIVTEGAIMKSTNGGSSWQLVYGNDKSMQKVSIINSSTGWAMGFYGDDVGTFRQYILKTTNGGNNWDTQLYDTIHTNAYKDIQFKNENTGYLLRNELLKSTNGGNDWFLLDTNAFTGSNLRSFYFINESTGWVTGGTSGKIFRTTNGGTNWSLQNTPASNIAWGIYFINESQGWALTNGSTILKTTTGGVTSIQTISSELPESYTLHQNYPNPFNPETRIKFEIPKHRFVSLKVYDISGKEVSALFNGELAAGVYEYSFDGSGLGSGVYFYKLQSGDFTETRRMVLVK